MSENIGEIFGDGMSDNKQYQIDVVSNYLCGGEDVYSADMGSAKAAMYFLAKKHKDVPSVANFMHWAASNGDQEAFDRFYEISMAVLPEAVYQAYDIADWSEDDVKMMFLQKMREQLLERLSEYDPKDRAVTLKAMKFYMNEIMGNAESGEQYDSLAKEMIDASEKAGLNLGHRKQQWYNPQARNENTEQSKPVPSSDLDMA